MSELLNQAAESYFGWKNFSEDKEVKRLVASGIENVSMAFSIDDEKDIEGNSINSKISWLRLESPEYSEIEGELLSIEGKLYEPNVEEKGNEELIIFTPGFPGGNSGRYDSILLTNAKKMKCVAFFQSTMDEAITLADGHFDYWKKFLPEPRKIILVDGGNHSFKGYKNFVISESKKWFKKYLPIIYIK